MSLIGQHSAKDPGREWRQQRALAVHPNPPHVISTTNNEGPRITNKFNCGRGLFRKKDGHTLEKHYLRSILTKMKAKHRA